MTNTRAALRRSREFLVIIGVCIILAATIHRPEISKRPHAAPKPEHVEMEP